MQDVFANLLFSNIGLIFRIIKTFIDFIIIILSCQFFEILLSRIGCYIHDSSPLSLLNLDGHRIFRFSKYLTLRVVSLFLLIILLKLQVFSLFGVRSINISLQDNNYYNNDHHNGHLTLENIICLSGSFEQGIFINCHLFEHAHCIDEQDD